MRTIFYVDGYNLYYCLLYGTPHKWTDLFAVCQHLMPDHDVTKVKYFTSRIKRRDHDPAQPQRQAAYLQALAADGRIEVIEGRYITEQKRLPLASTSPRQLVTVIRDHEKGSDVNLAAHLLKDGFDNAYELPAVITNDSDLATPLRMIRAMGLPLALFTPSKHRNSALKDIASYEAWLRQSDVAQCQLPDTVKVRGGREVHKPRAWK